MNDPLISLFIDDEMTLDDKIEFVEAVHGSGPFKDETVELLHQEKRLRSAPVERIPERRLEVTRPRVLRFLRPVALAAVAATAGLLLLFNPWGQVPYPETPYRFVFYRPDVSRIEITGSFTDWKAVPMKKVGNSGYWEHTFTLPQGEYRFAYLLDSGERLPDPTIPERETDDFGSENSVLAVGGRTL
ncbi:MAG: glycogen-binding domain-containing protein [Deltaproteobacteria bacterium]|nr:glycogen-binding domain-containing protein [Deltaproteobacteria bacterium]